MQREFPDVAARIRVAVYFRTSRVGSSNGDAQRGSNGGQPLYGPGGGSHG
jgi:hypothetical protein